MGPKAPSPTTVSTSCCPTRQENIVRQVPEAILDDDWELVSVPASEIKSDTSQWCNGKSIPGICNVGTHCDDVYDFIDPSDLQVLKFLQCQMNLDYNPTQPGEGQKAVYGKINLNRKARRRWLQHAADVICSGRQLEVEQAYRQLARSNGLHEELARAILVHDISASPDEVRVKLAQNLLLLFLSLAEDHESFQAQAYLMSDQDDLLESFQRSLLIPVPPKRTKPDEAQVTSLVRSLLESSGSRVDLRQHGFSEEYTVSDNAGLYASLLSITRTKDFGHSDPEELRSILSMSPMFSGMTISVQDLRERIMKMGESLRIGFRKEYLGLPPLVLSRFGVGQIEAFNVYRAHIYHTIPPLQKPENNAILLLTWSTVVSTRQLDILCAWAKSENGWNLYQRLVRDVQDLQSVEQLTLNMAGLMSYRRLLPDVKDHTDEPIKGSYLADLDALYHSHALGNSGRVAKEMARALVRVFHSFGDQFGNLITLLQNALDPERPLLHSLDGFCDRYLRLRVEGQSHMTAIVELSSAKMTKLQEDDELALFVQGHSQIPHYTPSAMEAEISIGRSQVDNPLQIDVADANGVSTTARTTEEDMTPTSVVENHLMPPSFLRPDQYTLVRVSNVECRNVLKMLDNRMQTVNEIPYIEELSDGSFEMVVLKSYLYIFQNRLRELIPTSNFDRNYDPIEPTTKDVEFWGYNKAKKLYEHWFVQRAERIVQEGWPAAAAHFAHLLALMDDVRFKAAAGGGQSDGRCNEECSTKHGHRGCISAHRNEVTNPPNRTDSPANALGTDKDRMKDDYNDNFETISDQNLVLKSKKIVGISRSHSIWMFKIQFEESILSPEFYDELHIGGLPASSFVASRCSTAENYYRVKWKAQWKDIVPDDLWLGLNSKLGSKLTALASPEDDLLWRADSCTCIINDGPAYHLCMEPDCVACEHAIRSTSNQPHHQGVALQEMPSRTNHLEAGVDDNSRSRWRKAREILAITLQNSQEQHPGDLGEIANAILDLAS